MQQQSHEADFAALRLSSLTVLFRNRSTHVESVAKAAGREDSAPAPSVTIFDSLARFNNRREVRPLLDTKGANVPH